MYVLTPHTYTLVEENEDGNGLAEHYECSVCHKLFDLDKNETTAEALAGDMQDEEFPLEEESINGNNAYTMQESVFGSLIETVG